MSQILNFVSINMMLNSRTAYLTINLLNVCNGIAELSNWNSLFKVYGTITSKYKT
jgi:hypothetical protein